MAAGLRIFFLAAVVAFPAIAFRAEQKLSDPALEAKAEEVISQVRCMVCEGQPLSDSDAELAYDLRKNIREMIKAGKSEKEILDFLESRYGTAILHKPPTTGSGALLWLAPFVILVAGGVAVVWRRLLPFRSS